MTGTMYGGKIEINLSNDGEYRGEFSYSDDQPLTLSNIGWHSISIHKETPEEYILLYAE